MDLLYGQTAPGGGNAFSFGPLIMFALIFVIFYFIIILPAKRKQKQHQNLVNSLKGGERVLTAGGIYGTVSRVMDDRFEIQVDKNTKILVTKTSIAAVITSEEGLSSKTE
ncbi:MAG: preprotein translocase subunit YajC [Candidatus Omnitrophota bacterium]